ncbi:MAG: DUF3566 domain-containing protein [Actinomycetaceae bacterium]|nr:DUF3566 domain-containing protein [Actinomycetaceae bacterium]MDU0971037.1 DUF3566 domain-containing protein [Actinomycetaceae bacterium]
MSQTPTEDATPAEGVEAMSAATGVPIVTADYVPDEGDVQAAGQPDGAPQAIRVQTPSAPDAPEGYDATPQGEAPAQGEQPVPVDAQAAEKAAKAEEKKQAKAYRPRQIELVLARIDPWSVIKMTFLLSVAAGIALLLAALIVWLILNMMHVFSSIQDFVDSIDSTGMVAQLVGFMTLPRVLALTTVVGVANVALLTALAAIGAMLYNRMATLVGGVRVAFQDE